MSPDHLALSFELRHGLIFVDLRIVYSDRQSRELRAIVDTGSAGTAANINLFDIDYRRHARIRDLVGIGGRERVIVQDCPRVELTEGVSCGPFPIEFSDMDGAFGIDAIVGSDLLEQLGATISYPARQLRFKGG